MQLETIAKNQQESMISSFWTMLQECESKADNENDLVLKHQVNGWYQQWNRVTGDHKKPRWMR